MRTVSGRLLRSAIGALVIALAITTVPPAGTALGTTTSDFSSLYVDLDPQDIGYGIHLPPGTPWHAFTTSETGQITGGSLPVGAPVPNGFWVSDGTWTISYWQDSGPVVPGTYDVPEPVEEISCGPTCVTISAGMGNNCSGSGEFSIQSIAFAADGTLERVDADFDLRCFGGVMAGAIRYHDDRPTPAMLQTDDILPMGTAVVGDQSVAMPVTFTSVGTASTELGTIGIDGAAAGDFVVTADTCSGATLASGATCDIAVAFAPTGPGTRVAQLRLPDTTPAGARRLRLVGAGFVSTSLALQPGTIPAFGPAPATFELTVTPPAGAPLLFVDGVAAFGPADVLLADPARQMFAYTVTLPPGHHVVTSQLEPSGFFLGASADPIEVDVGTATTLTLSTVTDDGVAIGEPATLIARLAAGGPLATGTIQILDDMTDEVLAEGTPDGATSTLLHDLVEATAGHAYRAEFRPTDPSVEPADAAYHLEVVPGPRPETTMTDSPIWSNVGMTMLDGFSSPAAGVTFQCRVDLSDWFACTAPVLVHGSIADHVLSVRAITLSGLGDRTPATRDWLVEQMPPSATEPATRTVTGDGTGSAVAPVRATWSGDDDLSGVDHYLVSLSSDGGPWSSLGTSASPSVTEALRVGHAYRFRIRPVDRAGNVGGAQTGSSFNLAKIQDGSRRLAYRGSWRRHAGTEWWGGSARSATTRGSTIRTTFTGRSISWVGATGPTRGKAKVFVDGRLVAVVDLGSPVLRHRTVVWTANFKHAAERTVRIRVLGTAGRPRVDVDGFVVRP